MLRDYQPGNRITSIAVQDLGLGTIIVPSLTNVIVEWDDGTWSKERYQDIIFIGQSKDEPLPIPGKGGFKKKLVGSNDKQKDANTINIALEEIISRDLEQYMWSLRLFQTRPDGKSYPYK